MKISLLACLLFLSLPASALSPTSADRLMAPLKTVSSANLESIDKPVLASASTCTTDVAAPSNPIGEQVDELTFGIMLAAKESGFAVEIVEEEICQGF